MTVRKQHVYHRPTAGILDYLSCHTAMKREGTFALVVPQLRQILTGFILQASKNTLRAAHIKFVRDKVALGQVFSSHRSVFSLIYHSTDALSIRKTWPWPIGPIKARLTQRYSVILPQVRKREDNNNSNNDSIICKLVTLCFFFFNLYHVHILYYVVMLL